MRVAIFGATGATGQELLGCLKRREFPADELALYGSARSAGRELEGHTIRDAADAESCDIAFLCTESDISRSLVNTIEAGRIIDLSSAFRMDPEVPLVIPEVNASALGDARLIANPNCVAGLLVMGLEPLRRLAPIEGIRVTSYQSVSGAGRAAMDECLTQTRQALDGKDLEPEIFAHPIAFNLFSHDTEIGEDGLNVEERKVIEETRKIMGEDYPMEATCVRVPVLRAHTMAVSLQFVGKAPSLDAMCKAIESFDGVELADDRASNTFPMPSAVSGRDPVQVGRFRISQIDPEHGREMIVCGDQLLKGASLNAVQIAERLLD